MLIVVDAVGDLYYFRFDVCPKVSQQCLLMLVIYTAADMVDVPMVSKQCCLVLMTYTAAGMVDASMVYQQC